MSAPRLTDKELGELAVAISRAVPVGTNLKDALDAIGATVEAMITSAVLPEERMAFADHFIKLLMARVARSMN